MRKMVVAIGTQIKNKVKAVIITRSLPRMEEKAVAVISRITHQTQ
jgi:hypothetical protein